MRAACVAELVEHWATFQRSQVRMPLRLEKFLSLPNVAYT